MPLQLVLLSLFILADAIEQEAAVMARLLTPDYMMLHRMESTLKNTRMFIGNRYALSVYGVVSVWVTRAPTRRLSLPFITLV